MRRRSPRRIACRSPLCHECEDAVKSNSETSEKQGDQTVGFSLSPNAGRRVLAADVDVNDPTVQLANIVVELEDGCVERIKMSDNESAEEVARKVCKNNDLPDQFVALLAEHIIGRYPQRPVDKQKEEVTANSEETKEINSVKNRSEASNSSESKDK